MNKANYCTLAAAKRLHEAGIMLETEYCWVFDQYGSYLSITKPRPGKAVPAPSMAEVWRELPDHIGQANLLVDKSSGGDTYAGYVIPADVEDGKEEKEVHGLLDINPADALIDLLIWVRKERG